MRRSFGAALIASVLVAVPAGAVVPGGSGAIPDCYAEFDGITDPQPGAHVPRVACTDGDPSCDADGVCGNGVCLFRIRLCINQHDPVIPICSPPRGGLRSIRVLPHAFASLASGIDLRSSVCGAFVDVPVPVRHGARDHRGHLTLRVVAVAHDARPSMDDDRVSLFCNPRLADEACGIATTTTSTRPELPTTTTTIPVVTTTTTTTSTTVTSTTSTTTVTSTTTAPPPTTSSTTTTLLTTTSTTTLPSVTTTTTTSTVTTSTSSTLTTSTTNTSSTTVSTTTTATSTTSTSTTLAGISSCPAGGKVDVVTTLVPGPNTFNSNVILAIEVDVGYPAAASLPGTGFLSVDDPADPATVVALLSADFSGQGINLYDGSPTFFDADTAAQFKLKTLLTLNPTANLIFNQTVPFERARFTCTPGAALTAASFPCTITSEVDIVSRTIPVDQRPACNLSLSAP